MSEEKLLTVRDVSIILGVSEKEVMDLAENGTIPAYKIGGVYLRFKREQIQQFKNSSHEFALRSHSHASYSIKDRVNDFFYFNDFYILTMLIILLLLFVIFRGY